MAYIRFLKGVGVYQASVIPDGNIVTVKFTDEKKENTSGFDLFLDKKCTVDIGGDTYHEYTTMYRNDETTAGYNGYQLSNDGSVYVESEPMPTPEPVPEPEDTLDDLKERKIKDMEDSKQNLIAQGVDVILSDGSVEKFTLAQDDQTKLSVLQKQVDDGAEQVAWHTSDEDEHCKFYSAEDMTRITSTAFSYILWHETYFRDLRIYIRSMESKEDVEKVTYGMDIPEEYQSEPLKAMLAQKS